MKTAVCIFLCVCSLGKVCRTGWSTIRGWVLHHVQVHLIIWYWCWERLPGMEHKLLQLHKHTQMQGYSYTQTFLLNFCNWSALLSLYFLSFFFFFWTPGAKNIAQYWSSSAPFNMPTFGSKSVHIQLIKSPPSSNKARLFPSIPSHVPYSPLFSFSPPNPPQTSACLLSPHGAILLDNKPQWLIPAW